MEIVWTYLIFDWLDLKENIEKFILSANLKRNVVKYKLKSWITADY